MIKSNQLTLKTQKPRDDRFVSFLLTYNEK